MDEKYKLIHDEKKNEEPVDPLYVYEVYPSRWWVLFVFWFCGATHTALAFTFGELHDVTIQFFGWNEFTLNLHIGGARFFFFIPASILILFMSIKVGIRWTIRISAFISVVSSIVKCFVSFFLVKTLIGNVLLYLSSFMLAINAPTPFILSPRISRTWFEIEYSQPSTTIGIVSVQTGIALSTILGAFVHHPDDLKILFIVEAFVALVSFGCSLFFHESPPSPPSAFAQELETIPMSLTELRYEVGNYFEKKNNIIIFVVVSTMFGFFLAWLGTLPSWLTLYGLSSLQIALVGFFMSMIGVIGGYLLGRIIDTYGHIKQVLVLMIFLMSVSFTAFFFMVRKPNGFVTASFVLQLVGGSMLLSTMPLYYYLISVTSESPRGEFSATLLTIPVSIVSSVFLLCFPWMNATVTAFCLAVIGLCAVLVLLFMGEELLRKDDFELIFRRKMEWVSEKAKEREIDGIDSTL